MRGDMWVGGAGVDMPNWCQWCQLEGSQCLIVVVAAGFMAEVVAVLLWT